MSQVMLGKNLIVSANGKGTAWVYDGTDVEYIKSSSINYKYYTDENGKRHKTRPYTQWTAMTGRCKKNGSHQKRYECYLGVDVSLDFLDFDKWVAWAQNQVGFMCLDENGRLYQLDKDLLGNGKLYSKDTCCFLPCEVNTYLVGSGNCHVTDYIDRGFGFELRGSSRVFDYEFLDTVSKINSKNRIRSILCEYFDILCEDVIERLIEKSNNTKYGVNEKQNMSGKIICTDYFTNFLVIHKRNISLDECHGVLSGYKGRLEYTYNACGYDWCKIVFGQRTASFSDNISLEIYTLILRILVTRWYLLNDVLCEHSRGLLEESLIIMVEFYGKYKSYQINSVSDHGSVEDFTKNAIDSIYKCCGGLKVTW